MWLVGTGPVSFTVIAAVAVAVITTILLVIAGAPTAVAAPHGPAREASIGRRPGPRRLAFEGLIVLLSVVGAYLLRERGLSGTSSATELAGADPFIALVPALAGTAAGILAVRIMPLPMFVVSRLAALRRDLVPVLALRRVTRGGTGGAVLIVLMAAATIGTFSGATLVHLDRAAEAVAWQEVGASYRVTGTGPLPASFDPAELPGVQFAASQYQVGSVLATRFLPLQLVAIDAPDYAAVVRGTDGDPDLPLEMLGPSAQPIPAIVSRQLTTGNEGVDVGGEFDLVVEGYAVKFRVVEVRESFPSMPSTQAFVIASRDQLRGLRGGDGLRSSSVAYLRAPDDAADGIRAALASAAPGARLASRAERTATIQTSPVVRALVAGVAAAAFAAFAYAALAVSAALALSGAARAVEVAHLRTLGLTRREALGLVAVEHGPTIIVAFGAGVALGLGLFALLRDRLGLGRPRRLCRRRGDRCRADPARRRSHCDRDHRRPRDRPGRGVPAKRGTGCRRTTRISNDARPDRPLPVGPGLRPGDRGPAASIARAVAGRHGSNAPGRSPGRRPARPGPAPRSGPATARAP